MAKSLPHLAVMMAVASIMVAACRPIDSAAPTAMPPTATPPTALRPPGAAETVPGADQTPYVLGETLEPEKHAPRAKAEGKYPLKTWDALVPEDWDPMRSLEGLDFSQLSDSDPRAMQALQKLQDAWKNAPVNPQVDNTRMKIAGFVVPLDGAKDQLKEFLLVPYFGACIHVPPPPSNQVIHVLVPKGLQGVKTMDAVWVSGALRVERSDTAAGSANYRMTGDIVEAYSAPSDRPR